MWIRTIAGNQCSFLFESAFRDHYQYMTPTATGVRGKAYEVGAEPTEVPDIVGGYALANVPGIEECDAPEVDEPEPPKRQTVRARIKNALEKKPSEVDPPAGEET